MNRVFSSLFLAARRLAGPFHRRHPALGADEVEREDRLPPLPAEWSGDGRWYRGDFPPRRHNAVSPLAHGEAYFTDLLQELEGARERVTIAAWCLTPLMPLRRGTGESEFTVAKVLDRVSRRAEVYVLIWSGAPALFQPNTSEVEEARHVLLEQAPRVHCELDRRARFSHDHHQKAVTIDGRLAYVGGMDLTTFQGDRWDVPEHPLRYGPNWHDVQLRCEGEAVRDVEENFCQRWSAVASEWLQPLPAPPADPAWDTPAQVVRTVPSGFYPFAPHGIHGIRHALLAGIRSAQRYIYLENQYIWDPDVVQALIDAMNRPHSGPFRIALVIPARAFSGKYDNDQHVQALRKADGGRGIFQAYSIVASGPAKSLTGHHYSPIYVHAKVTIVDDLWLCVGSANLNERGLATDTEIAVQVLAEEPATSLRVALWAEHLGMDEDAVASADPVELLGEAWPRAADVVERALHGGLPSPRAQAVRYAVRRGPRARLLDMVQDLTLEH